MNYVLFILLINLSTQYNLSDIRQCLSHVNRIHTDKRIDFTPLCQYEDWNRRLDRQTLFISSRREELPLLSRRKRNNNSIQRCRAPCQKIKATISEKAFLDYLKKYQGINTDSHYIPQKWLGKRSTT